MQIFLLRNEESIYDNFKICKKITFNDFIDSLSDFRGERLANGTCGRADFLHSWREVDLQIKICKLLHVNITIP